MVEASLVIKKHSYERQKAKRNQQNQKQKKKRISESTAI